ncbi:unnamed protein product [marine sediment metagenome]|uniref:Uncharacterized protein n=1 Tax=marine sediment metagenome TaxID=412755 RepID=X0SLZ2_9ZZZZ
MSKTLGQLIDEMISCNIKIWHTATQLKDINGKLIDNGLSTKEKVEIHTKTRLENAKRSSIRYEIDKIADSENAVMDIKINYTDEERSDDEV